MCRLMTTQLAEALEGYPLYSQDGKGKEAVCRAVFALGSVRWFILEGNRGLGKLQVRQQQDFNPVPLKQIQDSRLQEFLERFE